MGDTLRLKEELQFLWLTENNLISDKTLEAIGELSHLRRLNPSGCASLENNPNELNRGIQLLHEKLGRSVVLK